ncbi:hypothetical protein LJC59_01230 [Desulfovibrio sp. OttesenSCG-928-A18]|nr:hypothetical protein [Desulfovibrio sp. OttesenSCG-928-A18]
MVSNRQEQDDASLMSIPRPVEILVGVRAIAGFLKLSQGTVRRMEKKGAPITRDANNVMRAEKAELWIWMRGAGG